MSELNLNDPAPTPSPTGSAPAVSTATTTSDSSDLAGAVAQLQREIFNLRLTLLIVVGAVAVFFWREAGYNKFEAAQMQPQVAQASQLFEAMKKQDTSIADQVQKLRAVAMRLGEYGKLHPDYAKILAKYGVVLAPATNAAPAQDSK